MGIETNRGLWLKALIAACGARKLAPGATWGDHVGLASQELECVCYEQLVATSPAPIDPVIQSEAPLVRE